VIHMENNLDQLCFEHGIKIPLSGEDNNEKTIQKLLGIIQEDGVFAFFIYLKANNYKDIENRMRDLLNETLDKELNETLESIKSLGDDINKLLLAKSLIEKTLIYARYQAKSMGG